MIRIHFMVIYEVKIYNLDGNEDIGYHILHETNTRPTKTSDVVGVNHLTMTLQIIRSQDQQKA